MYIINCTISFPADTQAVCSRYFTNEAIRPAEPQLPPTSQNRDILYPYNARDP
jgi:hypothetical protein